VAIIWTLVEKKPFVIIIWNRHGHECSRIWKLSGNFTLIQCIKKCRDILGTTYFSYYRRKKNLMLCKHRFPCNTLTHSINEDLLSIKRKGDPEVSYPLSYVRYHWNPEPVCNKSHLLNIILIIFSLISYITVPWNWIKWRIQPWY
jgi:hypothetical protein